eukprot:m.27819 g.27819  ORF g.27819 m.27819 type:complete len:56 (-) comp15815_c0_seq1:1136-1303(-)
MCTCVRVCAQKLFSGVGVRLPSQKENSIVSARRSTTYVNYDNTVGSYFANTNTVT